MKQQDDDDDNITPLTSQEYWVQGINEGLADAEAGRFASEADIERVLTKYQEIH